MTDTTPELSLRQRLRKQRCDLPNQTRVQYDHDIRGHLSNLVDDRQFRSIGAFWPFDGEPDLLPLLQQLMTSGCNIALPVLSTGKKGRMQFYYWRTGMALADNRFGIPEPPQDEKAILSDFDLLLMPLVAYDRQGNRLGVGGGYYDRYLEHQRASSVPLRVGVAYHLQELEQINSKTWDIPLHGVVNERGWFTFIPR